MVEACQQEDFHSRMLPFYLYEDSFDKKVISWPEVKRNPRKSGMHYIFPIELLKNKGKEAGVGSSSRLEAQKKESLAQMDSEEEEETQPLECKKRMFLVFP
jgi:hypothetical protein